MAANYAWGVDIGNRALKAIKLVRDGDHLRIDDYDVIEHETVLSNAGDNREALIQTALATFAAKHQLRKAPVGVGVSGQSSFARFVKLPPVEPKKIPEIVRFEAIQQIPFPLDDVEWSYQLFQSTESPDVEVGIFAMRKELVNQHIQYFTDSELNVQIVQMNPLAVYNAMFYDGRMHQTTMLIDVGAETTDLIIADEESIWMRSIPIGGNNFTEALVKAFKLNFQKAEELKRNAASSKYARQIFQAMRPVFADLVAEVQRSMGFYSSVHRDNRIRKIVGIGGTFKLPGLQKYLSQNLQIDVERLDTLGAGAPSDEGKADGFNENLLSMVSAYGLALQAMGEGKITSSLLPVRIRRERMWQAKTKWFAAAAALFALGTGVGYGSWFVSNVSYDKQQGVRTQIKRVIDEATRLDNDWATVQGGGGAERQKISNVQSLANYRDLWSELLEDFVKTLPPVPEDVESLKQTPRGLRQQIVIDSLNAEYVTDMGPVLAAETLKSYLGDGKATQLNVARRAATRRRNYAQAGLGSFMQNMQTGNMSQEAMQALVSQMGGNLEIGGPEGAPGQPGGGQAADPNATRGFLVEVRGTTPYVGGTLNAPFIDTAEFLDMAFVKALEALKNDERLKNRRYRIERAELITIAALSADRKRALREQFEDALNAKNGALNDVAPAAAAGPPAAGGPAAAAAAMQAQMAQQQGMAAAMARSGYGARRRPSAAAGTGSGDGNTLEDIRVAVPAPERVVMSKDELDRLSYTDRLTGEDVLRDSQFFVAFAVVLK